MGALKFSIDIAAKPDEVFGYVADLSRHGEWANPSSNLNVQPVSGGTPAVGSTFRSTSKFAGKPVSAELAIREFDAPRRLMFAAAQGTPPKVSTFTHTFTFESTATGTRVTRDIGRENASPFAILGLVFYPAIKADAMKGLRGLKEKIEGGAR
jgi:uncharacterized protein YndB with AHSA1/START domain